MPQIRKTDRKDLSFSVSPWQSKRGSTQISTDQAYTEVQVPFKKPKTEASFRPEIAAAAPAAARKDVHPHGWRTRNKGGTTGEISSHTQPKSEGASNSTSPAPELTEREADYSEPDEDLGTSLVGTAVLALLPNGQISGHLLDAHSSKCFGIMGRQLTAKRECTRDFEWKLLYVTIIDFKTNKEVSFPAERTAADAATIQAPLQMHGEEQQIIEALHGHLNTDVSLKFQCTTIMTGEAAERHLLTLNPKLCGKAAVVNKGTMEVHRLPFLQMGNLASTQETFNKQASAAYDSEFDDE